MLYKVCNCEDRYAITVHMHGKSSCVLLIFVVGINFLRKAVTRNLFSKWKASSKYLKINALQKLPAIRYIEITQDLPADLPNFIPLYSYFVGNNLPKSSTSQHGIDKVSYKSYIPICRLYRSTARIAICTVIGLATGLNLTFIYRGCPLSVV